MATMPATVLDVATTIVFATSAYGFGILGITRPTIAAEKQDTTHQTTPNRVKTFMPGWFTDPGEYSFEAFDLPDSAPLVCPFVDEVVTVTYPTYAGYASGTIEVFTGFMISHAPSGTFQGLRLATVTVAISGIVARTAAVPS